MHLGSLSLDSPDTVTTRLATCQELAPYHRKKKSKQPPTTAAFPEVRVRLRTSGPLSDLLWALASPAVVGGELMQWGAVGLPPPHSRSPWFPSQKTTASHFTMVDSNRKANTWEKCYPNNPTLSVKWLMGRFSQQKMLKRLKRISPMVEGQEST